MRGIKVTCVLALLETLIDLEEVTRPTGKPETDKYHMISLMHAI